jgi:hypothetical protein
LPPSGANVTATYNGSYAETHTVYGAMGIPEPAGSDTGGVEINANFGASTVSIFFTSGFLHQVFGGGAEPLGSITSNGGYSAELSTFSNAFPAGLRIIGAFYGPSTPLQAPLETAGTFSGTLGSTLSSTGTINGSFGAHR